ncbi:hypothetical protein GLOTRDRAFT_98707 [Gloeophyllum trabeum ATCC 11539]|uniref:Uncharacterized protein n=1 Tax=Gloeophyllum trabeum (strain ATCC 11539 / FP-39264 / Madison 617) TaxID=670483 RepID=S7QDL7_GLOTA|nr:uncharacterized protein GLOTRDRAFT_98707 [Gloeophyllum trabeum ATCC 11539]EPQ57921.1 hypothetical protein GLOTRDRAFT_98707 [Gloeophyllum trabeum ATCC 11539]
MSCRVASLQNKIASPLSPGACLRPLCSTFAELSARYSPPSVPFSCILSPSVPIM